METIPRENDREKAADDSKVGLVCCAEFLGSASIRVSHMVRTQASQEPSEKGRQFEAVVMSLYQLLGYEVTHDTSVLSKQIDLLCAKAVSGAPTIRLFVECKYRENGSVSSAEIASFIAAYEAIRVAGRLSGAIMVSNNQFGHHGKALVSDRLDIRLLTDRQLFDELLNVSVHLKGFIDDYATRSIITCYIPLKARMRADTSPRTGASPIAVDTVTAKSVDVYSLIQDWLSRSQSLAVILGEFGSGKTTLLQYLKYVFSHEYRSGRSSLIPFYLSLRNFTRSVDLAGFVREQLNSEFGTSDFARFKYLLEKRRFLFLLDGFDEIGKLVDDEVRRNAFAALTPLFGSRQKAILTCRPNYFLTHEDLLGVLGTFDRFVDAKARLVELDPGDSNLIVSKYSAFVEATQEAAASAWPQADQNFSSGDASVYTLDAFSPEDIDQYLQVQDEAIRQVSGQGWETLRNRINDTFDLADLARRPILLHLIVQTLPRLNLNEELSIAVIYNTYTAGWLDHEASKGEVRWLVDKKSKLVFMKELAFQMYCDGKLRLHYLELSGQIKEHFGVSEVSELKYLLTDIQTCTFLTRDDQGMFEFIHKSFMEFFVAAAFRDSMSRSVSGRLRNLEKIRLSPEVMTFLSDFTKVEPRFKSTLVFLLRLAQKRRSTYTAIFLGNLIGVLGRSGFRFTSGRWFGLDAESLEFTRGGIRDSVVDGALAKRFVCRGAKLASNDIRGASGETLIDDCLATDTRFSIREGHFEARHSNLTRCTIGSESGDVIVSHSELDECTVGRMRGEEILKYDTHIPATKTGHASGRPRRGVSGDWWPSVRLSHTRVAQSVLRAVDLRRSDLGSVKFERCHMIGVWLSPQQSLDGARGPALVFRTEDDYEQAIEYARAAEESWLKELDQVKGRANQDARAGDLSACVPVERKLELIFTFGIPLVYGSAAVDSLTEATTSWLLRRFRSERARNRKTQAKPDVRAGS